MSTISTWTLTKSDMEENYDQVKALILRTLVEEGAIEESLADNWCAEHTVILTKKSIFKTITDRFSKAEGSKDSYILKVVRSV